MLKPAPSQYLQQVELKREQVETFDAFPFSVPAIRNLEVLKLHPKVTFFVGENGSGKSTLLESIAEKLGFNLQGGSRIMSVNEYQCALTPKLQIARSHLRPMDGFFLRAESYHNFATGLDDLEQQPFCGGALMPYGGKSLHAQSHGESFFATLVNRLGGHGIYLFDEPEAALSPMRQMSLLVRMHDLVGEFSQFIIATHSPILMAYPDAWIYQFDDQGIQRVEYQETDHYQITSRFLRDPEAMLRRLLKSEEELDLGD